MDIKKRFQEMFPVKVKDVRDKSKMILVDRVHFGTLPMKFEDHLVAYI